MIFANTFNMDAGEFFVLSFFQSARSKALTVFFGLFSLLGETKVFIFFSLLALLFSPKKKRLRMVFALLLSAAFSVFLKYLVLRPRPYLFEGIQLLRPPLSKGLDPHTSFPSGHTQLTATLSALLVTKHRASVLFLVIPVLVGLSRLYFGVHYITDVIFGLFFGFSAALYSRLLFPRANA